jgi:hypothetical protein
MNGMDMMVNAILKATGFDREQFDTGIKTAKEKAANFEARFAAIEAQQTEMLGILRNMHATPRAADAQDSDHAG